MTMNTFSLLLLAAALVAANSATIRGSSMQLQEQDGQPNRRRHLMQESTCTLFRKCVTYPPTEEHPNGHHEDTWVCELSKEDTRRVGAQFVDVVESSAVADRVVNATSGKSMMTVSEAFIDTDSPRMYIPEDAHVEVGIASTEATRTEKRRHLATTHGTLKTLVIRVSDKNNVVPDSSVSELKNDIFDDAVSLKTQTDACSYGKLKIEPFQGNTPTNVNIQNGIVDVKIDFDITTDDQGMDQAALKAANQQLGDLNDPMFGLVMFCFPPGRNFLAFAYPNSKYSFYNNQWCGYVSAQMHEVGHNLGLGHSGEVGGGDYGDRTGMMGGAVGTDDVRRCYNPQKNFQLGWYDDKTTTINPLDGITSSREFILNGVSDYERNNDALVALRLSQVSMEQDYYVGFNRAEGINRDTWEDLNMVTIVRKEFGGPGEYGQSIKVASLNPGDRHVIENFNKDRNIQIVFLGLKDGDAKILVIDNDDPPPGNCQNFDIELKTDNKPWENSWYITDPGGWVVAASQPYTQKNTEHVDEVCLSMGANPKNYEFTIVDESNNGLCCQQGQGSYKAYKDNGQIIFSGGDDDFASKVHSIAVPKDPNPAAPTVPPTQPPTAESTPPPPCEEHTIVVETDNYPGDNFWEIVGWNEFGDEIDVAKSDKFTLSKNGYETKVCLTEGRSYEFRMEDSYGDGIGNDGFYRVFDKCSEVVVEGKDRGAFGKEVHTIEVDNMCEETQESPTLPPSEKPCSNQKKRKFKISGQRRKKTCRIHAKKKKCDLLIEPNGQFVWQVCQKACQRCGDE
jgi:hypothetical protein